MKHKGLSVCVLMGVSIVVLVFGFYITDKLTLPKIRTYYPTKVVRAFTHNRKSGLTGQAEYFRQQPKSMILEEFCRNITKPIDSKTVPPVYPYDGIGTNANLSDHEYETSHFRSFCSRSMSAIIQVYSAAHNFERRKAIRETIGKQCLSASCRVMFVVGVSLHKDIVQRVRDEYEEMGDMFVKDKVDTYFDLNNKAVAMLDWLLEYCQQPRYVLQLIDDSFINVNNFIQEMDAVEDTDRFFFGKVFKNQHPHRNIKSIYYVSKEIYPYDNYPDFAVGISAAFPNSLTREMRCAVHRAKYVWMADVWLFGHVKEYLDIQLISTKYLTPDKEQLKLENIDRCLYVHHTGPDDFYTFQGALESKVQ